MSCRATCGEGEVAGLYDEGIEVGKSLGTDDWTGEALTLLFSPVSPLRAPEGPKGLLLWMDKELCLLIRPLRG